MLRSAYAKMHNATTIAAPILIQGFRDIAGCSSVMVRQSFLQGSKKSHPQRVPGFAGQGARGGPRSHAMGYSVAREIRSVRQRTLPSASCDDIEKSRERSFAARAASESVFRLQASPASCGSLKGTLVFSEKSTVRRINIFLNALSTSVWCDCIGCVFRYRPLCTRQSGCRPTI